MANHMLECMVDSLHGSYMPYSHGLVHRRYVLINLIGKYVSRIAPFTEKLGEDSFLRIYARNRMALTRRLDSKTCYTIRGNGIGKWPYYLECLCLQMVATYYLQTS